jgi:hypothetical protein
VAIEGMGSVKCTGSRCGLSLMGDGRILGRLEITSQAYRLHV